MTSLSEQNRRNLPPPFRERRSETVGLRLMRVVLKTDSRVLAVRPDCYRADRLGVYALDWPLPAISNAQFEKSEVIHSENLEYKELTKAA
jgi:hypothetical protein